MERRDYKITKQKSCIDDIPISITVDASLTEFSGTRREADLIVRALMLLQAELERSKAIGLVFEDSEDSCWNDELLGRPPKPQELVEIIEKIKIPHYIGPRQLIDERIKQSNI